MAKFIKSLFQTEKKPLSYDEAIDDEHPPPIESRRKLSVSRSGRMKQAQKKRLSLTLDIYGDDNLKPQEKPKTREYRVHPMSAPVANNKPSPLNEIPKTEKNQNVPEEVPAMKTREEEEIDTAFEVIEKT